MNTARAMAWLPTTAAEKYKAKQALDTFFVRLGDLLSAGLVFVGAELLAWQSDDFAWFNLVTIGAWLALSVGIARRYQRAAWENERREQRAESAYAASASSLP